MEHTVGQISLYLTVQKHSDRIDRSESERGRQQMLELIIGTKPMPPEVAKHFSSQAPGTRTLGWPDLHPKGSPPDVLTSPSFDLGLEEERLPDHRLFNPSKVKVVQRR